MYRRLWQSAITAVLFTSIGAVSGFAQRQPTAQAYTFKNVKIVAGGFISGFVAHPKAAGVIYVRTDIGGTYKWDASYKSWVPLTDAIGTATWDWAGTESIALDPTDPNRLYLAQGMYTASWSQNGGFLVSTNQGAGFKQYAAPFQMGSNENGRNGGERLAVNPFKTNELYFGTRLNGLWKSEDYAATWTQVMSFPIQSSPDQIGIISVLFDPMHSGTLYAAANQPNSFYKSTDDGATWQLLPNQPSAFTKGQTGAQGPSPLRASLGSNGILYVTYGDGPGPNGLGAGDVWKFDTIKNIWTNITPPLDPYQSGPRGGFCGLSIDPNNPNLIATATLDRWYPVDSVYVSKDAGATWVSLAPLASIPNTYGNWAYPSSVITASPYLTFGGSNARFGWWQGAILIDPFNPDHLMYGTGATIFGTENLSAALAKTPVSPSWTVMAEGIEETAVLTLISPTAGAYLLSGLGDIGGYRHDNFFESPAQGMFTNPTFTTEDGSDWAGIRPLTIARVGTNGASPCAMGAYSTDQGTTWTPFPTCASGLASGSGNAGAIAVSANGTRFVWSPGNGNPPQFSADYGTTWQATGLPASLAVLSDKRSSANFYSTDGNGKVYVSSDGAQSFAQTATVAGANGAMAVNFAVAGDVWMGGNKLYHSSDYGKTWTTAGPPSLYYVNQVAIGAAPAKGAPQTVFIWGNVNGQQGVYRSTDWGMTWIRVNDDEHQYSGDITTIAADSRVFGRYYLGTNGRGIIYGDIAH